MASQLAAYCRMTSSSRKRARSPLVSTVTRDLSTSRDTTAATGSDNPPAHTCSAASRANPPANTDSRRNTARSSSASRSWLQSSVAANVACRSGTPWIRPVSVASASSSRAASSAAARCAILEAASSSASGMPSRRRQMRATGRAVAESSRNAGEAFPARSRNSCTESRRASRAGSAGSRRSGSSRDGTRQTTSPGRRRGSRLVASTATPAQRSSNAMANSAQAPSRCSQLSSSTTILRSASCSTTAAVVGRAPVSARPRDAAAAAGISRPSRTPDRSTSHTPAGSCPRRRARSMSAAVCGRRGQATRRPPAGAR